MKTRISIALAAVALSIGLTSQAAEPPPPTLNAAQVARVQAVPAIVEGARCAPTRRPACRCTGFRWRS